LFSKNIYFFVFYAGITKGIASVAALLRTMARGKATSRMGRRGSSWQRPKR